MIVDLRAVCLRIKCAAQLHPQDSLCDACQDYFRVASDCTFPDALGLILNGRTLLEDEIGRA